MLLKNYCSLYAKHALKLNNESCNTDEDRAFVGTWCTNELEVALEKGYIIQKIYEVILKILVKICSKDTLENS